MNVSTLFFFEKYPVNLLLLSSGTIINSKFRNDVNIIKLSKSRKNFQKFLLNFTGGNITFTQTS